ncbi:prepilin-type N-terminal cleavage/methylation domain-containing protein [Candidatus Aerophobetes bacterium]|nr:prepilin-type N-terminal cleavage/methylation domain-containing protein [Candidatus Aerophobetes bacterium]
MILIIGKLRDKNEGFTLIELLIVLSIICAVLGISIFYIDNFLFRNRLETSAQDIAVTLRLARRLSITKRREYKVAFNQKERKYWIENKEGEVVEEKHQLEKNVLFANPHLDKYGEDNGIVEFDEPDDNSFSFYPQGTAEAGSIYLENRDSKKWYTITISPTTGCIRVYSQKH